MGYSANHYIDSNIYARSMTKGEWVFWYRLLRLKLRNGGNVFGNWAYTVHYWVI